MADGGNDYGGWENWNWRSRGDTFLNGAFFTDSGSSNVDSSLYAKATSFSAKPSSYVETLTANAGPFQCGPGVNTALLNPLPASSSFNNTCSSFILQGRIGCKVLGCCFLKVLCPVTRAVLLHVDFTGVLIMRCGNSQFLRWV